MSGAIKTKALHLLSPADVCRSGVFLSEPPYQQGYRQPSKDLPNAGTDSKQLSRKLTTLRVCPSFVLETWRYLRTSAIGNLYNYLTASANTKMEADACEKLNPSNQSVAAELSAVNTAFGDGFSFIGKYDSEKGAEDSVTGWNLSVGEGTNGFDFSYIASFTGEGTFIGDWVLYVKVGTKNTAYLFENMTFDIDGLFNSFNIRPEDGDYSHISGFVRGEATSVPEPSMVGMLGLGLLAMGFVARRRMQ